MKVWELKEGNVYTSDAYCDLETTKYKIVDGKLYYSNPTINYGEYMESGMEYNRASCLNFTIYTPPTDWSKVEVDTKVLVSQDGIHWYKRYFAKYKNGQVFVWHSGKTSFSDDGKCYITLWNHTKLYTEESEVTQ